MNSNYMIEIDGISKSFKDVKAVNNLSFRVKKGELFAFLGVNGAGKSTTISMICGGLVPDCGTITVDGCSTKSEMQQIKSRIGVVFQDSVLDKPLTAKENLRNRASLYGITGKAFDKRICELADMLQMEDFLNRPVGKLSGGQRRRVDIARALIHKPSLLILDEPTTGLDPQTRKTIGEIIDRLRREDGLTVLLTTHYMEEAANADYVVIIDSGSIAAEGTPHELKTKWASDSLLIYGVDEAFVNSLGYPVETILDGFSVSLPDTKKATELIVKYPEKFNDYELIKGGMDSVFLAVTGKKAEGGLN